MTVGVAGLAGCITPTPAPTPETTTTTEATTTTSEATTTTTEATTTTVPASGRILDQENDAPRSFTAEAFVRPGGGRMLAQTFTAGVTGELDQVSLEILRRPTVSSYLDVEIQTLVEGVPSGTVIGRGRYPGASGDVHVELYDPASVVSGGTYAIVLLPSLILPLESWLFAASTAEGYAGDLFASSSGVEFNLQPMDLRFRTWVTVG